MSFSAYSEYKNSGVELFEKVPSRWRVQRLKQVVNPSRPITYGIVQAGENVPDGIPYIRPADMTDESGVKAEDTLLRTSPEIANSYKRSSVVAGDIVCSIGPSFGKLMMVPSSLEGSNLTQGTARVAVSQDHIPRFLFWVLKSVESYQQWESSVGGATFRALNLGPLAETFICVPSPAEQAHIARFLDHETARIDALIEEQQRLIELLKEKRQAVISHAVTKGLDPTVPMKDSGVEWLGEVPAHWVVAGLKWFWSVTDCKHITAEFVDDGIPLASIREVQSRYVALDNAKQTTEVFYRQLIEGDRALVAGDLIFSRNATVGEVAQVASWHPPFAMGQDVCVLKKQYEWLSSDYLQAVLRSPVVMVQLDNLMIGSTFKRVNVEDIRGIIVPMPPQGEQRIIAKYLIQRTEMFDSMLGEAQNTIALLQERRSALISAAVTGKIDVRGWQPPASAPTPELVQEAV